MNIDLTSENTIAYSSLLSLSTNGTLHKNPTTICFDCGNTCVNGLSFDPLPGFHFGICGPISLQEPIIKQSFCDVPVIVAFLFLEGKSTYAFDDFNATEFNMQKNMFLVGRWEDLKMEISLPAQENYTQLSFMVLETSFKEHFGQDTTEEVYGLLKNSSINSHTFSGIAEPEMIISAKEILTIQEKDYLNSLRYRCTILDFFAKIIHNATLQKQSPAAFFHEDDKKIIKNLKATIEKDFLSIESASVACSEIGMGLTKANSIFKKMYSSTIAQYINKCKMVYAYSNLIKRKQNVSECAFSVGYVNVSQFISAFKKHYGMTPKAVFRLKGEHM